MDRRFGLDQGFDVYDSRFDLHRRAGIDPGDVKRPELQVAAAAIRWLERNWPYRFFCSFTRRPAYARSRGYEGELDYVDNVLGNFLNFLEPQETSREVTGCFHLRSRRRPRRSRRNHAWLFCLPEHAPRSADRFIWPPGFAPAKNRVDAPASLLDVTPTILETLSVTIPPGMQGHSLKNPSAEVYAESRYAERHFGCSALRHFFSRAGRLQIYRGPKAELYDLSGDPGERNNLYDTKKSDANSMRQRLISLRNRFPTRARMVRLPSVPRPELLALWSLGYLAGRRCGSFFEQH